MGRSRVECAGPRSDAALLADSPSESAGVGAEAYFLEGEVVSAAM